MNNDTQESTHARYSAAWLAEHGLEEVPSDNPNMPQSPLPWLLHESSLHSYVRTEKTDRWGNADPVCLADGDAAFIVNACNNHHELIALLKRASAYVQEVGSGDGRTFTPDMNNPETKLSHEIQALLGKIQA